MKKFKEKEYMKDGSLRPKRPEEASSETDKKILSYIWSRPHAGTIEEIAKACDCSPVVVVGVRCSYRIPAYVAKDGQKYLGSIYME